MKQIGEKISMLTAYDYPAAQWVEEAGVDMILVGDSLGMVVLGAGRIQSPGPRLGQCQAISRRCSGIRTSWSFFTCFGGDTKAGCGTNFHRAKNSYDRDWVRTGL